MAGEKVLIVEDRRENIVHLANNVLKPSGYQVITAMDGQRGLQRILADRPDLVILDMNMPRMDGLEVLAVLQERQVDVPVILTTFYGSEQVAEQALRLGAVAYVVKPYDPEEMLAAVRKALARRTPPSAPTETEKAMEELIPLTRQVERWMRDMNILTRVGKALVALLDLERICIRAVEAAIYVTRADYGLLFLKEDDAPDLRLRAMRGPQDQRGHYTDQAVIGGLAVQAAQSGEAMRWTENPGDAELFEIVGEPLGPVAAVPLRWQRKTVGVLLAARSRGEASFSEADSEWLSGLADYAAIAVRNAHELRQRAQPAPAPELDGERIAAWRHEVAQLAEELEAARTTVQRLAAYLGATGGNESH